MTTMAEVMTQLQRFPRLRFRIEGGRLWVEGSTFQHRKALRKMGLTYIKDTKKWYWEEGGQPESKPPRFPIRSRKYKQELSDKSSE